MNVKKVTLFYNNNNNNSRKKKREMDRKPCPFRVYEDLGVGFTMGCTMGGIFHFIKGARYAPRGDRLTGAYAAMKQRGPIVGGNFAVWGGLFSTFECILMKFTGNNKESAATSIASGALTGGVLAVRGGTSAVVTNAVVGALFLGLIEGCSATLQWYMLREQQMGSISPPIPNGEPKYTVDMLNKEFLFAPSGSEQ